MKQLIVLAIITIVSFSTIGALAQSTSDGGVNESSRKYRMSLRENGEPHFAPMNSNDPLFLKDSWDSLFFKSNAYDSLIDKGLVTTIASDGDNLYLGGSFEFFGGIRCYNVIRYNRTSGIWSTLDSGFNATVNTLQVHNGKLYAGGRFNRVGFNGTTLIGHVAMWNDVKKKWEQVGGGVNNSVGAIAFKDTSVIVGGYFTIAGTTPVSHIARWNGFSWDDMNGGVQSTVWALLVSGDSIYAGGSFYSRSQLLSDIGLYTAGNWYNLGDGLDGDVYALAMVKGELWVGGDFSSTAHDKQELNALAKWNGTNWIAFGSGTDTGVFAGQVYSITPVGDSVYIGGSFISVAGVPVHGIAKWHNGTFTSVGTGVYGDVHGIAAYNGSVYLGGTFLRAGNDSVGNVAQIVAGDHLQKLNPSVYAYGGFSETFIEAIATTPQFVFIGGAFSTIAGKQFNHIAAWDKINRKWVSLGKGVDRDVEAIAIQGSNVYAGGNFNYAGDSLARHIAYWDMNAQIWHPMGNGSVRYIAAIAANSTGVYASVFFPFVLNFGLVNYIGQWNGYSWTQLNGGINGYINAIALDNTKVYIGGTIKNIDHLLCSNIAMYDGSNWLQLGTGADATVLAITIANSNTIYAAGNFSYAGNTLVNGIARWDGNIWTSLGGGLNRYCDALSWNGSTLFIGGGFDTAGSIRANYIAKWDGSNWSSISNGTGSDVYALAVDNTGLYVGGAFNHVNNVSLNSYRFGILHFASAGVDEQKNGDASFQNFPNPFSAKTTISYTHTHDGPVKIEIYNLLGNKVKTVLNEFEAAGDHKASFNATDIPSGTLYARISTGFGEVKTVRLVHEK